MQIMGHRGAPAYEPENTLRSIRRIVKRAYRLAGVRGAGKTSHSLRHSAITSAIRHGAPLPKVQSMARHASLNTTMIYYHELDRVEDPAEGYVRYDEDEGNAV